MIGQATTFYARGMPHGHDGIKHNKFRKIWNAKEFSNLIDMKKIK